MRSVPVHFKFLAPIYERFVKPSVPKRLLANLSLPPDGSVLDAAGGTGRVSQFFVGKTARVVLADQTFQMLQEARKKEGISPVDANTEQLPFAAETFCCIIMVDALHHVKDQAATIQELWRILKPGGRIIIEEPDFRQFSVKVMALVEKVAMMRSHFLAPDDVMRLFNFAGATQRTEVDGWTAWVITEKK